jgi:hypothetical protein
MRIASQSLAAGQMRTITPRAPMYKFTGLLLARWTITGAARRANYAKPG